MMTIFLKLIILSIVIFTSGCASQFGAPTEPSTLNLNYKVSPKNSVLIRAFDNQKETLLQFSDIEDASPVITEKGKKHLKYSKIGHYIVVTGIHNALDVKTKEGVFSVVRLIEQHKD